MPTGWHGGFRRKTVEQTDAINKGFARATGDLRLVEFG
jgi:hypothetical protein